MTAAPTAPASPTVEDETGADWRPVDLGPALRGELTAPAPDVLRRDDGSALLYGGQVNSIHGDSGSGKSWIALLAAVQEIRAGRYVLWIDFEDPNEATIVERLRSFGLTDDEIVPQFVYLNPQTPADLDKVSGVCFGIDMLGVSLVVIDSVGEAFGVEGLNEDRDDEVGPWLRRVVRPLAATGAAVLLIDHATKANANPLHPSGSKRKRAAVTGAAFYVEPVQAFSRTQPGALRVICAKDRHGNFARGSVAAHVAVDPGPPFTMRLLAGTTGGGSTADVSDPAQRAVRACQAAGAVGLNLRRLRAAVGGRAAEADGAIDRAVAAGALEVYEGERGARMHRYVRPLAGLDWPFLQSVAASGSTVSRPSL
jgi:hypothetical protein